jgi:hypothetical protein
MTEALTKVYKDGTEESHTYANARDLVVGAGYSYHPEKKVTRDPAAISPAGTIAAKEGADVSADPDVARLRAELTLMGYEPDNRATKEQLVKTLSDRRADQALDAEDDTEFTAAEAAAVVATTEKGILARGKKSK